MAVSPGRGADVLLVEDDAGDALMIREALAEHSPDRRLHEVADGVAAMAFLRDPDQPRPHLIILDLNMPRMDGREVLARLKADAELSTIPVVVLSTSCAPEDVTASYRARANAFVTKPADLDAFTGAVREIDGFFLRLATLPPG